MKPFLNTSEWTSILKGTLVAAVGAALTYATECLTGAEIPADLKPVVVAAWSVFANYVRKVLSAT